MDCDTVRSPWTASRIDSQLAVTEIRSMAADDLWLSPAYGADTIGVSYATTMWGKILTLLGSENIAVGKLAGASGRMNPEAVIAADPDAIFIAGSSWANKPKAVKTGYET
eukprot:gene9751-13152_t